MKNIRIIKTITVFTAQILIVSNSAFAGIGKTDILYCFRTTLSPNVHLPDNQLQASFMLAQKKSTTAGMESLGKQFSGLTADEFKWVCRIIDTQHKNKYKNEKSDISNNALQYYTPIQLKFGLPPLATVINTISDRKNLDKFIEDFYMAKIKIAPETARASRAAKNFYDLSQAREFQESLAEIIQIYYKQSGNENGRVFINPNESVAMSQDSFVGTSIKLKTHHAVANVHTHYIGFSEIAPTFFLPGEDDVITSVKLEHKNLAILWGDVELGFYLTLLDTTNPKLKEIVYEILRNEEQDKPVDIVPLDEYRNDIKNYKYYKLIPQGTYPNKGAAVLEEISYPQEMLAKIPQNLDGITNRLWAFWEEDRMTRVREQYALKESDGENPLGFLKTEREKALAVINDLKKEILQNSARQYLGDLVDFELLAFMQRHELKAQELYIKILDSLIKNESLQPQSVLNISLVEQSI